jgi:hypothetical protein
MTASFVKVYQTILDSSVWLEDAATRLVWLTMLVMADEDGNVQASVGGLAHRARVSREEAEGALRVLLSPDPDDRSGVNDGIRLAPIRGGWHIVNHREYRDLRSRRQAEAAERVRRHRQKASEVSSEVCKVSDPPCEPPTEYQQLTSVTVTLCNAGNAPSQPVRTEAEADTEKKYDREVSGANAPSSAGADAGQLDLVPTEQKPDGATQRKSDIRYVFEAWKHDTGQHRAKLDRKREARISARLRDGFSREDLVRAIANRRLDPFLMGENPHGRTYNGIQTLLRDVEQVERLLALDESAADGGVIVWQG